MPRRKVPSSNSLVSFPKSLARGVLPSTLFHRVRHHDSHRDILFLLVHSRVRLLSGPVDTTGFREGKSEQAITAIANNNPAKRLGTVDDIAPVVAFLASPEAAWVNGQNILVNGVSVYILYASLLRWGS